MKRILIWLCVCVLSSTWAYAQTPTLMPFGATWKYLDDGSDQGSAWKETSFDDTQWKSGPAELGYGETDTKTVVSYGTSSSNKYPTTYFRTTFNVQDASAFTNYALNYKRDDGIIVYINGTEIFRDNMAATGVNYKSYSVIECTDDGNTVFTKALTAAESYIVSGTNVLAIEVHQRSASSSDITLDVELKGTLGKIFTFGSVWKYLDNGSDQGTAWQAKAFDDSPWKSGPAELGYGETDTKTIVSYGPSASNKYQTTYFRSSFNVYDPSLYDGFKINYKRDDAIIVYINGEEIFRDNIAATGINYLSYSTTECPDDGNTVFTYTLPASANKIVAGTNSIAVEVHQRSASSSDITLDMEIDGYSNLVTNLTRGPYLQMGTSSSMTLRWRTDNPVNSIVSYGTDPANLNLTETVTKDTTEHLVTLKGLSPYTKYYYSIGYTDKVLQGDAQNYFVTSPVQGTEGKYSFWVTGDCGNNSTNQKNVRDQFYNYRGNNVTNGWLLLGDNAYSSGTDGEFKDKFFGIYDGNASKNIPLWPAPGNHDYGNGSSARQLDHDIPYYKIFETPTKGEAGGVASGTEAFYSFDYGNVHFLSLDSYGKEDQSTRLYDTTGAQVTWIKKDLAANKGKWTIAYWHHPPYTMGSHNSDTEGELVNIRKNFIRILERNGVDLILCGHSHDYERSKLMKGHYDNESTFDPAVHNLSQSTGKYDGSTNSCTYLKDSLHTLDGTVYVVSGSAGQLGGQQSSFPHEAMRGYSNATNGGSMVLEVEGSRLDAIWLNADGQIRDRFTVIKDASKVKNYTIDLGDTLELQASWKGDYVWSNDGTTTKTVKVAPKTSSKISVTDQYQCLADTFKITVNIPTILSSALKTSYCAGEPISIPFAATGKFFAGNEFSLELSDANGDFTNPTVLSTITSIASETFTVSLPASVTEGSGYKVRIVSSKPSVTGDISSQSFTLENIPSVTLSNLTNSICKDESIDFTAAGANTYEFFINGNSQSQAASNATFNYQFSSEGTASVSVKGFSTTGCVNTTEVKKDITVKHKPAITVSPSSSVAICQGEKITLSATNEGSLLWNGSASTPTFEVSAAGSIVATATLDGCSNSATVQVSVNSLPAKPVITVNTTTLTSSAASGNKWFLNGQEIANATDVTLAVQASGSYKVVVTDANGCSSESDEMKVTVTTTGLFEASGSQNVFDLQAYPNPFKTDVTVSYNLIETDQTTIEVITPEGHVVSRLIENQVLSAGQHTLTINGNFLGLKTGMYLVKISTSSHSTLLRMNYISE